MDGICGACGRTLPENVLVELGGRLVCADCKPNVAREMAGVRSGRQVGPEEAGRIKAKLRRLNLLSFAFGLPGLVLQGYGNFTMRNAARTGGAASGGELILFAGLAMFVVGLWFYAKLRGRNGAWGLLGLLSCIGLIVLYFLPKRCHACGEGGSFRAPTCRLCGAPM